MATDVLRQAETCIARLAIRRAFLNYRRFVFPSSICTSSSSDHRLSVGVTILELRNCRCSLLVLRTSTALRKRYRSYLTWLRKSCKNSLTNRKFISPYCNQLFRDTLSSMGVCVRIIGDITMLPTRIQRIASEMMLKTRHNTRLFLNICMAYGGQNELTDAAERIRLGVRNKVLHPSDVNPDLLSQCLYTGHSRPLDLFIRSSGEVRLSDFLVWQAAHSGVVHKFVESYWPNFSLWDLLGAILHYQLTLLQMSRLNPSSPYQATGSSSGSTQRAGVGEKHRTLRIRRFLSQLDRSHWADLEKRSLSFQAPSNTEPRIIQRSVGDSLLS
ncbi:dehydrodolichyl diphosphate synthase [Clonorchis sinensis]|uniref:Alkyl transferase n=1 Tax=Clonorchis sinensis TaxID=79923 RepID=G7YBV3_CLOSI|nr:dehydrodolichyl diphosphate synthase [Clonorchis sinensis]